MTLKEMIRRQESIIDGDTQMEELFRLERFPIHMGVTALPFRQDVFQDMIYEINEGNGAVQIGALIPEDELYQEAHYNNIGKGWEEHHKAFARFMAGYCPKSVFEIGGGRGLLSIEYSKLADADWTILEAVPNPDPACNAHYISGFFSEEYVIPDTYDAIVHTHTLEHFYNPLRFMENIGRHAQEGTRMFFSIPNMGEMIDRCYTNVMSFEHTFYCAEPYVTYICEKSGYKVEERVKFKEDHSVFYVARRDRTAGAENNFFNKYAENKKKFLAWKKRQEEIVNKINVELEKLSADRRIYIFGAHVNTQYLLAFHLNIENVKGILDNDPHKQGKRLYGTKLPVSSPDVLCGGDYPVVILRGGTHNLEIKDSILRINRAVQFIEGE